MTRSNGFGGEVRLNDRQTERAGETPGPGALDFPKKSKRGGTGEVWVFGSLGEFFGVFLELFGVFWIFFGVVWSFWSFFGGCFFLFLEFLEVNFLILNGCLPFFEGEMVVFECFLLFNGRRG